MTYHLLSFLNLCILQEPAGSYSYRSALVGRTLVFLYIFSVLVFLGGMFYGLGWLMFYWSTNNDWFSVFLLFI